MQVPEVREKADLTKYRNAGREVIQVRRGMRAGLAHPETIITMLWSRNRSFATFCHGGLGTVLHSVFVSVLDPDPT